MRDPGSDSGKGPGNPPPDAGKKISTAVKFFLWAGSTLVVVILGAVATAIITPARMDVILGLSDEHPATAQSESGTISNPPVVKETRESPGPAQAAAPTSAGSAHVQRLAHAVPAVDSEGVVTTVTGISESGETTEIALTVQNNLAETITLPASMAEMAAADGSTLEVDAFAGNWTQDIPSHAIRRGTIVFNGVLPRSATTGTFSFSTVFVQGFDGPKAIIVRDLPITPPAG